VAGGPDFRVTCTRPLQKAQGAGASATTPRFSGHHGDLAVGLARWPYDDFHVLPERGEDVHEAFEEKAPARLRINAET
jgi:hypothetical protein